MSKANIRNISRSSHLFDKSLNVSINNIIRSEISAADFYKLVQEKISSSNHVKDKALFVEMSRRWHFHNKLKISWTEISLSRGFIPESKGRKISDVFCYLVKNFEINKRFLLFMTIFIETLCLKSFENSKTKDLSSNDYIKLKTKAIPETEKYLVKLKNF